MSSSDPGPAGPGRRCLLLAPAALLLSSCGFQLRGAETLSFRSMALTGFAPRSPLAEELRVALSQRVRVETAPARAELILQALTDVRERSIVATTAAAQVREVQLRLRLRWRTHTPAGREITAPAELALSRDMSYSESIALAKQHEEAELYREMQTDIVAQVLRRLSVIRL
jgi:LPS-assembly lipoprotein